MEKMNLVTETRKSSFPSVCLTAACLLLTLLLCAVVTTLIVLTMRTTSNTLPVQDAPRQTVHLITTDGYQMNEQVSYERSENVAIFYGDNGELDIIDYAKGLHVMRDTSSGTCYVMPVSTSPDEGWITYQSLTRSENVTLSEQRSVTAVTQGEIEDISFLPRAAQKNCQARVYWVTMEQSGESSTELARGKRDTRTDCYVIIACDGEGNCELVCIIIIITPDEL